MTIAGELAAAFPGALCFKGGFVLRHAYGQQRMSNDIDATRLQPPKHKFDPRDVQRVIASSCREHFRLRVADPETDSGRSLDFADVRYHGPCGGRGVVAVEVGYREGVVLGPVSASIGSPFYEPFDVPVLDPREVVAEKLRAIAQRQRATDLADVAFLLVTRGVRPERDVMRTLITAKFELVGGNHLERVRHGIGRLERGYDRVVRAVAPDALDYDVAAGALLPLLDGWFAR